MSPISRLAMWLFKVARFWPIRSQCVWFQMHAVGVAFDAYLQDQRTAEAAALIPQYVELTKEVYGPNPDGLPGAICMSRRADFGRILHNSGATPEGTALIDQSMQWFQQHPAEVDAIWGACLLNLGGALVHVNRPQEGIEWLEKARALRQQVHGPNSFEVAQCQNNLGVAYQDLGQLEAAEQAQREALRLLEMAENNGRGVAMALNNLSGTLTKAGRADEAERLSLRAVELAQCDREILADLLDTLADSYEAQAKSEQALTTRGLAINLAITQNKSEKVNEFGTKQAALMDRAGRTEEAAKCRETMETMRLQALEEHTAQAARVD